MADEEMDIVDENEDDIDTILEYCGFEDEKDRANIAEDGFESFDDILTLADKDMTSLAKCFAERTSANGRIIFGFRRTNVLKATVHRIQDFGRISKTPSLEGIPNMDTFKDSIEKARQRAQICKHNSEESDALSKASNPGKLKRQKDWLIWSRGLINYLSTILGQDGVPLSYVIRDDDAPDREGEEEAEASRLARRRQFFAASRYH